MFLKVFYIAFASQKIYISDQVTPFSCIIKLVIPIYLFSEKNEIPMAWMEVFPAENFQSMSGSIIVYVLFLVILKRFRFLFCLEFVYLSHCATHGLYHTMTLKIWSTYDCEWSLLPSVILYKIITLAQWQSVPAIWKKNRWNFKICLHSFAYCSSFVLWFLLHFYIAFGSQLTLHLSHAYNYKQQSSLRDPTVSLSARSTKNQLIPLSNFCLCNPPKFFTNLSYMCGLSCS